MIEKKVGNVTLRMSEQGAPVNVVLGELVVRIIPPMGIVPDFGPGVVAAIEDLRKPLAKNECWGPEGERMEKKPKKPSERLAESTIQRHDYVLGCILDELAEKVGGL